MNRYFLIMYLWQKCKIIIKMSKKNKIKDLEYINLMNLCATIKNYSRYCDCIIVQNNLKRKGC